MHSIQTKLVLTEKGLRMQDEMFSHPDSSPPPFVNEAKPPSRKQNGVQIETLYENNHGYLDRNVLKSADSNRPKSKPFFLPEDNEQDFPSTPFKYSKYPGIYPPKPVSSKSRHNQSAYSIQNSMSPPFTNSNSFTLKGRLLSGDRPLILDSDGMKRISDLAKSPISKFQQFTTPKQYVSDDTINLQTGTSNKNIIVQQNNFFYRPNSSDNLPNLQNIQAVAASAATATTTGGALNQQKMNELKYWASTKRVNLLKHTLGQNIQMQEGSKMSTDKNLYTKSLQNRMELKKADYLRQREVQDQKLKQLSNIRSNLSKDPVHVAARYLQDLKSEDSTVENLVCDVNFAEQRYKNRLQEYHIHKYKNMWNKMTFPQQRNTAQIRNRVIGNSNNLTNAVNNKSDLVDDLDQTSPQQNKLPPAPTLKSISKLSQSASNSQKQLM